MATSNGSAGFTPSREDGVIVALDMLREMRAIQSAAVAATSWSPFAIEAENREPGAPQNNLVQSYLDRVRAGGRELEEGFACLLTEYLASALAGFVLDLDSYEQVLETEKLD